MNMPTPKLAVNSSRRVLIVDDEELLSWCIGFELRKLGYEVHLANNIEQGRRALLFFEPKLIICDQSLPDGNILDFLKEWHENHERIESIIMTAYTPPSESQLNAVNVRACLRKPFAISTLLQQIDECFLSLAY